VQVVIDYTPAIHQGAGIGRYTRGLVDALADLDRDNRYTLFCAGTAPPRKEWPSNFTLRSSRIPSRWLTTVWHRMGLPIPAEALVGDCDLYHSPDFVLPPLKRACGIVTVHDLTFMRLPDCADHGLRAHLNRSVPKAVRAARHVLADSWSTRNDLIELLQVPAAKVSVVPAGVDAFFSRVEDPERLEQTRARYGLPQWFIVSVGTLEPRKNYVRLVSAYALMRRQTGLPHHLVIAGKPGWLYGGLRERIRDEGVSECVHLLGFVPDADLPALYTLADLMVFPSLYEGFGIPPLEAMACGTPVVSSNNSSLPESVGSAAQTVNAEQTDEIADAMARVLGNAALRSRLIELGYLQAAQFTWHTAARKLLAAYTCAGSQGKAAS
jgi:glycosyltransferase involved in cell wall biosynthesis